MKWDERTSTVECYGFVVDTDTYAGNFEREVVAHMTGEVGDCGVGKGTAKRARVAMRKDDVERRARRWLRRHVISRADDNGCRRPAAIHPTTGWLNDGHGNAYREEQAGTPDVATRYVATVRAYYEDHIERATKRAEEVEATGDLEQAKRWRREVESHRTTIAEAETRGPGRFASYQSAVVWLDKQPPTWVIDVLKKRAVEFLGRNGKWRGPVAVSGFRVLKMSEARRTRAV